jgi:hypothetical protein
MGFHIKADSYNILVNTILLAEIVLSNSSCQQDCFV